jgi:hypothetical protein
VTLVCFNPGNHFQLTGVKKPKTFKKETVPGWNGVIEELDLENKVFFLFTLQAKSQHTSAVQRMLI